MTDASQSVPDWAARTEQSLLDAALVHAPVLGWSDPTVRRAAADIGLSDADAALLVPHGPRDLAALLSRRHDQAALDLLAAVDPLGLKVRERIARGLEARVEVAAADDEATRRSAAYLALPQNAAFGLTLAWETADTLWRWAGDTATDENHYSKRAILSGILVTALPVRLASGSDAAHNFIQARVANVMQFERWKAGLAKPDLGPSLASLLGKLRYR